MSSTILSSLGEAIIHRNSLATITDNWVVVREADSHKQILLSIDSICAVKTFKTIRLHYVTCAVGSILIAIATACSKQSDGAFVPFTLLGLALLISAQATRRASLAFLAESETIRTAFGSVSEAATLVAAIQSARQGKRRGKRPTYELFLWLRAYITLLV